MAENVIMNRDLDKEKPLVKHLWNHHCEISIVEMTKGENKFAKANELKDEMMKICQSDVKMINEVDTLTNIYAHPSLFNFDVFYQFSLSTQTFQNRYVDENWVLCMLEEVLSSAVREIVCERYSVFYPQSFINHFHLLLSYRIERGKKNCQ